IIFCRSTLLFFPVGLSIRALRVSTLMSNDSAYSAYSAVTFAQRTKPGTNPAQTEPPFQSNNLQRLKNEPKPDQKRTEPEPKVEFFLQAPQFTLSVLTQFSKTPEPTEPHFNIRRL